MKRFAFAMLFVVGAVIARSAAACPVVVKAVAIENTAVVAVPVKSIIAPVVVEPAPVVAAVAAPTVPVVAVPTIVEKVVKVRVKAKRQFRTPVRSLLFR